MQTLRPLVTGTDFSDCAEEALEVALGLAGAAGTGLTLVHVCELSVDETDEQQLYRCREMLATVVAKHRGRGVEITAVLRSGRPWEKLDNLAVEVGASLIVIGRYGAGGVGLELGTVADHLVRSASRPVLTVSCHLTRFDDEADENTNQRAKENQS
ncbi:MAG TPA: universal stress protein [Polyangiaceae bacterium]|nr:universal stress protein [Polyangiaceae bacterium]